jgi:hypothetical protein
MRKKRRYIRYLILLSILFAVAAHEAIVKAKIASWEQTLQVRLFAVNGDGRRATDKYIKSLKLANFQSVERFLNRGARHYDIPINVVKVSYAGELKSGPPKVPGENSLLKNIIWSLHFRGWALYQSYRVKNGSSDIDLFINYYDTATTQSLRHSVGLRGGLIGLINGFASKSYQGSNNVVVAHELMHTLGATDKYNQLNQPAHPGGFAAPFQEPLFPQLQAEIMGGRIPVSATRAIVPTNLRQVVVGAFTAAELNWYRE